MKKKKMGERGEVGFGAVGRCGGAKGATRLVPDVVSINAIPLPGPGSMQSDEGLC